MELTKLLETANTLNGVFGVLKQEGLACEHVTMDFIREFKEPIGRSDTGVRRRPFDFQTLEVHGDYAIIQWELNQVINGKEITSSREGIHPYGSNIVYVPFRKEEDS